MAESEEGIELELEEGVSWFRISMANSNGLSCGGIENSFETKKLSRVERVP